MFRLKRSLFWVGILVFTVLAITVCYGLFTYEEQTVFVDSSIEDHPEGIVTEMALKSVGRVKAAKEEEFGYSKDFFTQFKPFWWQADSLTYYQALEERFDLEQIDYNFNFEDHSYLLVYGSPINKLYSDTRTMYSHPIYGKVPDAIVEWDTDTPYESEVMYIYETDKIPLVEVEWY